MGPYAAAGRGVNDAAATDAVRRIRNLLCRPRVHSAGDIDPDRVFAAVARRPFPVYLWSDGRRGKGRYAIVAHSPCALIRAECSGGCTLVLGDLAIDLCRDPLEVLEDMFDFENAFVSDSVPFAGGAIGYITYEHATTYLDHPPARKGAALPAAHFAVYTEAYIYDLIRHEGLWIGEPGAIDTRQTFESHAVTGTWSCATDRDTYRAHVLRILEHITAGDIYQANYTVRFSSEGRADPAGLALHLRRCIPVPMGAFLGFPFGSIWSLSPERLLSGRRGSCLESRPIKGTRPRATDPVLDQRLAAELADSPKDRAELLMIVDLVRNDLGKVAPFGSVKVERLFHTESYPNVHHLEATVSSAWPEGGTWADALRAVLPGGSVTGAPKQRAVEILAGLEPVARSVYTGAVGYLSACGRGDFNLPIRTLYHDGRTFHLHSGGGIVADSDPDREYEEMLLKVDNIRRMLRES